MKKRRKTMLLGTAMFACVSTFSPAVCMADETAGEVIDEAQEEGGVTAARWKGDINEDGVVDLQDAQIALKAALKITSLNTIQEYIADVDYNQVVDLKDAQSILKRALKIEANSPLGQSEIAYAEVYAPVLDEYRKKLSTPENYSYYLYDIDKDGILELIVQNGESDAEKMYDVYTIPIAQTEAQTPMDPVCVGHIGGNAVLFAMPDSSELGIVAQYVKQGLETICEVMLENGTVTESARTGQEVEEGDEYTHLAHRLRGDTLDSNDLLWESMEYGFDGIELTPSYNNVYGTFISTMGELLNYAEGNCYSLYDIDKDGMLELIVKTSEGEESCWSVFTVQGADWASGKLGKLAYVGTLGADMGTAASSLHAMPDESEAGILAQYTIGGVETLYRVTISKDSGSPELVEEMISSVELGEGNYSHLLNPLLESGMKELDLLMQADEYGFTGVDGRLPYYNTYIETLNAAKAACENPNDHYYYLYDINQDGFLEMIVQEEDAEEGLVNKVYAIEEDTIGSSSIGEVTCAGVFSTTSYLYAMPDDSEGILARYEEEPGIEMVKEIMYTEGKITEGTRDGQELEPGQELSDIKNPLKKASLSDESLLNEAEKKGSLYRGYDVDTSYYGLYEDVIRTALEYAEEPEDECYYLYDINKDGMLELLIHTQNNVALYSIEGADWENGVAGEVVLSDILFEYFESFHAMEDVNQPGLIAHCKKGFYEIFYKITWDGQDTGSMESIGGGMSDDGECVESANALLKSGLDDMTLLKQADTEDFTGIAQ